MHRYRIPPTANGGDELGVACNTGEPIAVLAVEHTNSGTAASAALTDSKPNICTLVSNATLSPAYRFGIKSWNHASVLQRVIFFVFCCALTAAVSEYIHETLHCRVMPPNWFHDDRISPRDLPPDANERYRLLALFAAEPVTASAIASSQRAVRHLTTVLDMAGFDRFAYVWVGAEAVTSTGISTGTDDESWAAPIAWFQRIYAYAHHFRWEVHSFESSAPAAAVAAEGRAIINADAGSQFLQSVAHYPAAVNATALSAFCLEKLHDRDFVVAAFAMEAARNPNSERRAALLTSLIDSLAIHRFDEVIIRCSAAVIQTDPTMPAPGHDMCTASAIALRASGVYSHVEKN